MTHTTVLDMFCHFRNAPMAAATGVTHMLPETGAIRHLCATTWEKCCGNCPFGLVFWENYLLPGTARVDISRQQEPSTGVLWGAVDRSLSRWAELCCLLPLHGPEPLLAKTGTATKRGQSTKPTKSLGLACAGTSMTLEGIEQEGAVDDTWLFNWTLAVWKDPLWQSASGLNVSSLGAFNCKSDLWTVFLLGAE